MSSDNPLANQEKVALQPLPVSSPVVKQRPDTSTIPQNPAPRQKLTMKTSVDENREFIIKWANFYGVNETQLLRVAKCESGFRSDAVNGHYWAKDGSTPTGLFQFVRSTYIANARRIGLPAVDDRLNPDHSAQVAAWMFSIGQSGQWECK